MEERNAHEVWQEVIRKVKEAQLIPALWRALDVSKGIAIEGDQIIVGIAPANFYLAGHLEVPEHRRLVEEMASQVLGRKVTFKVIEGTTLEDWRRVKEREEMRAATLEIRLEKRRREAKLESIWRGAVDEIHRRFVSTEGKQFPQVRAQFLREQALPLLLEAEEQARQVEADEEVASRFMARALERVADLIEIPPTLLALEMWRARGE